MCEDLEKQYNTLLTEYPKCVEKKMAPLGECRRK